MTNCSPEGIRYSYFSFNELARWCLDDLFYGPHARDLSYEAALEELKAEANRVYMDLVNQCEIAMAEVDHWMSDHERERFSERWFEEQGERVDPDDFVDHYMEAHRDDLSIDEPVIEGTFDGVSYRISWLGGAPHIFVFRGPLGYGNRLCSPCVPGAVDGSGGFTLESEFERDPPDMTNVKGYLCYCVPRDWLREAE